MRAAWPALYSYNVRQQHHCSHMRGRPGRPLAEPWSLGRPLDVRVVLAEVRTTAWELSAELWQGTPWDSVCIHWATGAGMTVNKWRSA